MSTIISSTLRSKGELLLRLIKWRLASVLKIEKCRHTDAKNSKLVGKNKEPFLLEGGDEEKE